MKKYLLLLFILLLVGCQSTKQASLSPSEKPKAENGKGENGKRLEDFTIKETFREAEKLPQKFSVELFPMEDHCKTFHYNSHANEGSSLYSPKDQVLYVLASKNRQEELMTRVLIYDLSTGEKKDVPLEGSYRYIDSKDNTENGYEFIGTNDIDGIVRHVIITKEGKVEQREVGKFRGIAASLTGKGFVVNTDLQINGQPFGEMSFVPYGTGKVEKIFQEPIQPADNNFGVVGNFLYLGYGVGEWIGFQQFHYEKGPEPEVKGTYLYHVAKKELFSFPFMKRPCHNFMGDKNFILSLEEDFHVSELPNTERCKLHFYNEKSGKYEYFVLPGYEYCGFIRSVEVKNENIMVVSSSLYIDFVDLKNHKIYRCAFQNPENAVKMYYHDGYLYYGRQEEDRTEKLYYKPLPDAILKAIS